jgi:hypothetical protein
MDNNDEKTTWPPFKDRDKLEPPKKKKEQFDGVGVLMTYVIGIGLSVVLIAVFLRLVLWILGISL